MAPSRQMPLIIHVPHSSTELPSEALSEFTASNDELLRFVGAVTDHFTDDLFATCDEFSTTVRHGISRIVVDPERFENDSEEPMAASGYGVLYERGVDGRVIRPPPSPKRREWLLDRWYRPHHRRLTDAVKAALRAEARVLIIDAHSYPNEPLSFDLNQRTPRPDACIGTCGMHTPTALIDAAKKWSERRGWTLGIDEPYAGTIVPLDYLGTTPAVMSIMVEINRNRYMRLVGNDAERSDDYAAAKREVGELVSELRTASQAIIVPGTLSRRGAVS